MPGGTRSDLASTVRIEDLRRTMWKYSEKKMDYTTISKGLTWEDTESKSIDGVQLFQMLQRHGDDSMAKTELTHFESNQPVGGPPTANSTSCRSYRTR